MKKIILYYPDMGEEAWQVLVEWMEERIKNKHPDNTSPLRYVDKMEVEDE